MFTLQIKSLVLPPILFILFVGLSSFALAGAYNDLTEAEKAAIQSGAQVVRLEPVAGAPWPRIRVYQRLSAKAEEAMSVLADFNFQKDYVPDVIKSEITLQVDKTTFEVGYKMHVPIFADEHYTTRQKLSSDPPAASFRLDWTLVRADSLEEVVGHASFEPLGTGALLAYESFIHPSSGLAGLLRKKAIKGVKGAVAAIIRQIEKERAGDRILLDRQLARLRRILN